MVPAHWTEPRDTKDNGRLTNQLGTSKHVLKPKRVSKVIRVKVGWRQLLTYFKSDRISSCPQKTRRLCQQVRRRFALADRSRLTNYHWYPNLYRCSCFKNFRATHKVHAAGREFQLEHRWSGRFRLHGYKSLCKYNSFATPKCHSWICRSRQRLATVTSTTVL